MKMVEVNEFIESLEGVSVEQCGMLNTFDCALAEMEEDELQGYAIITCKLGVDLTTVSSDIENN